MPSIFMSGASILDGAQVNTATGAGNGGQGTISVNNGATPFEADDFVVFEVQNLTPEGELDGDSGFIGAVVYDTYQDYLDGIPKYTYTPMNPGQEANVQNDLSGLGDSYVRFNANVLTSSDPGAPVLSELLLTPDIDWTETSPTSGETINRFTDHDFNDSGSIDTATTEEANGQFSVTDWNAEVLAMADPRDYIISATAGNDTVDAGYTGDPEGDRVDANDAADGSNDDVIDAGDGDDLVQSGDGDDSVLGGAGNDTIGGGRGNDTLSGGDGADSIAGDAEGITLLDVASDPGVTPTDLTVVNSADGPIELWYIDETGTPTFFATIHPGETFVQSTFEEHNWALRDETGTYLETIEGAADQIVTYGDEGLNDSIDGGAGNDTIFGQFGDDTISGGDGDDVISGGSGNDEITGGAGNDIVSGGVGSDTLSITGAPTGSTTSVFDGGEDGADDGTADGDNDVLDLSALTAGVDYTITYEAVGGSVQSSDTLGQPSEDGVVTFSDGSTLTFTNVETVICFAKGTKIATDRGDLAIETLSQGDRVLTRDHGFQGIRWIGSVKTTVQDLIAMPDLRPIRIAAGALGTQMPAEDLLVSPQHRLLVRSKIADRMFGEDEVLLAAKHLVGLNGIAVADDVQDVEYYHFLFEEHEIVVANGALTESLFTGPEALKAISPEARDEVLRLFPALSDMEYDAPPCRQTPNGRRARRLARRHKKNQADLVRSVGLASLAAGSEAS